MLAPKIKAFLLKVSSYIMYEHGDLQFLSYFNEHNIGTISSVFKALSNVRIFLYNIFSDKKMKELMLSALTNLFEIQLVPL